MAKRAFVISGFFNESEVAELMEAVRRIEQRHPEETYMVTGINREDVEGDVMAAAEFLERVFPRVPGKEVYTGVLERE